MTIYSYKGLTRNQILKSEIVWVLHNIWRLERTRIPDLARMSLMKYYWMLQNARVTAFTVSELLREDQHGGDKITPPPAPLPPTPTPTPTPRLRLNKCYAVVNKKSFKVYVMIKLSLHYPGTLVYFRRFISTVFFWWIKIKGQRRLYNFWN